MIKANKFVEALKLVSNTSGEEPSVASSQQQQQQQQHCGHNRNQVTTNLNIYTFKH